VYALTGSGPFGEGTAPALLSRAVHEEPDLSGIPDDMREWIAMCLSKDPYGRPWAAELSGLVSNDAGGTGSEWLPEAMAATIAELAARSIDEPVLAVDLAVPSIDDPIGDTGSAGPLSGNDAPTHIRPRRIPDTYAESLDTTDTATDIRPPRLTETHAGSLDTTDAPTHIRPRRIPDTYAESLDTTDTATDIRPPRLTDTPSAADVPAVIPPPKIASTTATRYRGRIILAVAAAAVLVAGAAFGVPKVFDSASPAAQPTSQAIGAASTSDPTDPPTSTGPVPSTAPAQATVPAIVGRTRAAAVTAVTAAGLVATVSVQTGWNCTEGVVTGQRPDSQATVVPHSTVRITVCGGPPKVTVPALLGLSLTAAKSKLSAAGLKGTFVAVDSASALDSVVKVSPGGGSSVVAGSTIKVQYSLDDLLKVPNFVGHPAGSLGDVQTQLTNAGFSGQFTTKQRYVTDTNQNGTVVGQSPGGGSSAKADAVFVLYIGCDSSPSCAS
jgi:beta-lactam-binding protein with PASTA domain